MTDAADAELVQRCRRRDTGAFGELVERHQRLVFGVALARCRDAALAEDLAQEAFVTAWRDLDRLRDDARVASWVAGIARNLAASAVRERTRHADVPELPDPGREVSTPEDAALAREDRELLAGALADVPDAHREALVLYYLEGESIKGIADALAIREDLVKQRLSRGRKALRDSVAARVESALGRVRARPALRAGVIAALPFVTRRKAAAAGKVLAVMTVKKIALAGAALALAGGAIWLGTRDRSDSARAEDAPPAAGPAAAPAATSPATPRVRRIDPKARATLVDAIRMARERDLAAATGGPPWPSASSSSSSSGTPVPALPGRELDKAYIRSSVRELIPLLSECYEKGLAANPALAGKVVVDFTIEGEPGVGGVVGESKVIEAESDLADPAVRECISETMYALEIDPPPAGGSVRVHYPFAFRPAGVPADPPPR